MRHQRKGRKLGRDAAHRKALYANLTGALVEHGRIARWRIDVEPRGRTNPRG